MLLNYTLRMNLDTIFSILQANVFSAFVFTITILRTKTIKVAESENIICNYSL